MKGRSAGSVGVAPGGGGGSRRGGDDDDDDDAPLSAADELVLGSLKPPLLAVGVLARTAAEAEGASAAAGAEAEAPIERGVGGRESERNRAPTLFFPRSSMGASFSERRSHLLFCFFQRLADTLSSNNESRIELASASFLRSLRRRVASLDDVELM